MIKTAGVNDTRCLNEENIYIKILEQKMPYGLLRTSYSLNPTQYSDIVGYSSHFYPHIGADH